MNDERKWDAAMREAAERASMDLLCQQATIEREAVLGTWPKTGHRLVRALGDDRFLSLHGSNSAWLLGPSEDDEVGDGVLLFVVAPEDSVALVHIGVDFLAGFIHWSGIANQKLSAIGNGWPCSVLPFFPELPPLNEDQESVCLIDPGPFVPAFDVSMYALLGLRSPWFLPRAELSEFLEGLNE